MQPDLTSEILELVRFTSTNLPPDVEKKLRAAVKQEEPGSAAEGAMNTIITNVEMARENSTPICQDTGTPIFYVHYPEGWSTRKLKAQIQKAVIEATEKAFLRPNSVDSISGKNTGNNTGDDHYPTIHFEEIDEDQPLVIELMLKGGGCENVGAQYKLPDNPMLVPSEILISLCTVKSPPKFASGALILRSPVFTSPLCSMLSDPISSTVPSDAISIAVASIRPSVFMLDLNKSF